MSGETERQVSGWTVDTLKQFHDTVIEYEQKLSIERDKRYQERWQAQQDASQALKEYQNEFRGALTDLSTKQATKVELETSNKTLTDKIDVNNIEVSTLRSRLDIGPVGLSSLTSKVDISQARGTGLYDAWKILLGALGGAAIIYGFMK